LSGHVFENSTALAINRCYTNRRLPLPVALITLGVILLPAQDHETEMNTSTMCYRAVRG